MTETTAADRSGYFAAATEKRGLSFCRNDDSKVIGRKKLALSPELRQKSPFNTIKTSKYPYEFLGLNNGLDYLKTNVMSLEETMERIGTNILTERKYFQNVFENLQCQVVQLEERNYLNTVKIENLQLYNSEKLKIIDSLEEVLNETIWKRDAMEKICEEHTPRTSHENALPADCSIDDKTAALKSIQMKLRSWLDGNVEGPRKSIDSVQRLQRGLDECVSVIDRVANRDDGFDTTVNNFIGEIENCRSDANGGNSVVEMVEFLKAARDSKHNIERVAELWDVMKNLYQENQCLLNRVNSLNMHKMGLELQLEEMETNRRALELKTMAEIGEVEKKEEILSQNESLIQQHWDEMDTSQEIVAAQTQRALEIYQELEDLQIEYDNHDEENRKLKTDLCRLKNELSEYQLKCDQLEKANRWMESEKNDVLEAYAKSWGHNNSKQKIKYTGKLIKDIDKINQEIKSLELECEKLEWCNVTPLPVKTPVFGKTQPKSAKTTRTFGVIDANKQRSTSVLRANVVRNLWYLP